MRGPIAQQVADVTTENLLSVEAVVEVSPEWTFKIKAMPICQEIKNVINRMKLTKGLIGLLVILTLSVQISFHVETSGQALYHKA